MRAPHLVAAVTARHRRVARRIARTVAVAAPHLAVAPIRVAVAVAPLRDTVQAAEQPIAQAVVAATTEVVREVVN